MAAVAANVKSPPLPPRPSVSPSYSATSTISPSPTSTLSNTSSTTHQPAIPPHRSSPSSTLTSTSTVHPSLSSPPPDTFDGHSGWLDKRAERGLQSYQRRYFTVSLHDQTFAYYKTPDSLFPQHFVPLSDILLVQLLTDQKKGCRFDVVTSHRVMQLLADTPKAAADWVLALTRTLATTRERLEQKTNQRLTRQPEPRTPTILKPFWQQGMGYTATGVLPASQSPLMAAVTGGVSGLKAAFFQLNFSVSALNQPDFFHDLLDDFRSDDDILAFLFDVLLSPDSNDNAARAILQSREIAARAKEGQLGAVASRLHTSNGSKADDERAGGGEKAEGGGRSKVAAGGGGGGGGKAGGGGVVGGRGDDCKEEESSQLSTNGPTVDGSSGRVPRTHSRQATATKKPRASPLNPPRLIRSRSDLCLDITHLSRAAITPPHPPRYDTDIGVLSPAGQLRASLPFFARYHLFRASANRSRDFAMFDARKKIVSWLHSDAAIRCLSDHRLMTQRLALPLLFALLQSRHHDDIDDDDHTASGASSMMFQKATINKARRSPSYDSDNHSSNSLANIFKQGNLLSAGQNSQPASPASPAIPLTPTASVVHSSPSAGSPFRSHLTLSSSHPIDATLSSSYADRDNGGSETSASMVAGNTGKGVPRHSPYNTPASSAAAMTPPRFVGNGRALNFNNTPTSSPVKPTTSSATAVGSSQRDITAMEFPYPNASHSSLSNAANRYATVRLPSPHSAVNASSANSVAFGQRGVGVRRPSLASSAQPLTAHHWRREYSSQCPRCRAAAQQLCELVSSHFTTAQSSGGVALSVVHVNALLSTLVTAVESLPSIDNIDSDTHNVFNKPVVNAGVWLTLFTLLHTATNSVKKHALKDITGVLVAANVGAVNCESVLQVPRWQSFVLPLLFPRPLRNTPPTAASASSASRHTTRRHSSSGLPAASASPSSQSRSLYEVSLREKVDQYAQNVMGVLHFHAFVTRSADEFAVIFKHSFLLAMRESKGGVRVPRSMLQVTLQRLISKLKAKAIELDERWSSIDYLIAFIKAFVMGLPLNTPQSTSATGSGSGSSSAPPTPAATGVGSHTHPQNGGHSHRESLFQSAASLLSSHHSHHSTPPRNHPSTATTTTAHPVSSSTAVLDFGFLRPPNVWKRGLLEDRDLIERTLQLMRRCRVYQDVDLSTFAASKQQAVKEQIEHGSNGQLTANTVSAALSTATGGSGGNSPSSHNASSSSSRNNHHTHKRQMSTAASLLSLPHSQSTTSSSSASSSAQSSKSDLFHPLNRFKLNATSEDLAISYLSWSAADRHAFLSVQKEVGWCKDVVVFVSVLCQRLTEVSDEQIGQLRHAFASGGEKREKVFGSVKSVAELKRRK